MKIGTKSLLFGLHQFAVHPFFVGIAWVKLYHKLPNWKEGICILIHDFGYWGSPNIDGPEGEQHPLWAAEWAHVHLDGLYRPSYYKNMNSQSYRKLCLYHSRTMANKSGTEISKLCPADKYGSALTPVWLLVLMGKLSGEIKELHHHSKYPSYRIAMTDYEMMQDFSRHFRTVVIPQWQKTGKFVDQILIPENIRRG